MLELIQSPSGMYLAIALVVAGFGDMFAAQFIIRKRAETNPPMKLVYAILMVTGFFMAAGGFYILDLHMGE
ncbi:MAG: hypothetical protein ACPG80_00970 [Rickettsiales bacterium]